MAIRVSGPLFRSRSSIIFLSAGSSAGQEMQTPQPGPSSQHIEIRTAGFLAFP